MARETWVQSQVESFQKLKKWYLMPPCLTFSIIRYRSRVKWVNPGKEVAHSPTPWDSRYRKGSLRFTFDYNLLIRWYSVYLERFPLTSHVQVFSCKISFVAWNIHIIVYSLEFFTSVLAAGPSLQFEWSKAPQVSRTLLSILAVFNNAVVKMVCTRPPISKFSSPFNKPLVTVLNAPITIGIAVTLMFHSFFDSRAKSGYLSFFSLSFSFILKENEKKDKYPDLAVLADHSRYSQVDNFPSSLFLLITIRSGLLAESRWSICMSKSHRSLRVSFSRTAAGLCIYYLFVWSNLNFLHISQWITLPTQSCLVLYSFCANLLHSLIMWLMVSSLSLHSLHLLFCCVLSILAWIWSFLWRCFVLLLGEILFLF